MSLQCFQPSHHILDLLGLQHRLTGPGPANADQARSAAVRWHETVRVESARVQQALAQPGSRETPADAGQIGCQIALEALFGYRCRMAQQAQAGGAAGNQRAATRRIAGLVGERAGQGRRVGLG